MNHSQVSHSQGFRAPTGSTSGGRWTDHHHSAIRAYPVSASSWLAPPIPRSRSVVPLRSTSVLPAGVVVSRRRWTPDEFALLDGPASDVVVAERVGRSVHAVVMMRWRRRNPAAVARDRAYAEENRDRNNRRSVIYRNTQRDKINAAARAVAAADRAAATRSGAFTPAEDAVVLRADLTARQAAGLLGRTAASVARRRKRLRA